MSSMPLYPSNEPISEWEWQARSACEARWANLLQDWPYPLRRIPGDAAEVEWRQEVETGIREGFSPLILTPRSVLKADEQTAPLDAELETSDEAIARLVTENIWEHAYLDALEAYLAELKPRHSLLGRLKSLLRWQREPMPQPPSLTPRDPAQLPLADQQALEAATQDPHGYLERLALVNSRETLEDLGPSTPYDLEFASVTFGMQNERFAEIAITRLPTAESWRAPLYLGFGGWNAAPKAAALAALAQRWHQLYGAQIACITEDTVEFAVARAPQGFEEAKRLALEHGLLEFDNPYTLSKYIACIRGAPQWYFWWD